MSETIDRETRRSDGASRAGDESHPGEKDRMTCVFSPWRARSKLVTVQAGLRCGPGENARDRHAAPLGFGDIRPKNFEAPKGCSPRFNGARRAAAGVSLARWTV